MGSEESTLQNQAIEAHTMHSMTEGFNNNEKIISTVLYGTAVCTHDESSVNETLKNPAMVARRWSRERAQSRYTHKNERGGKITFQ